MDLTQVLAQLRKERDALDAVIAGMERLEQERQPGPNHPISLVANRPTKGKNRVNGLPHHPVPDKEEHE
jgi:hypothetical protein